LQEAVLSNISQDKLGASNILFLWRISMSVLRILGSAKQVILSDLISVKFSSTKSHIVQSNGNVIYCAKYRGLKGLFRKNIEETRVFGRRICDTVAVKMNNHGFFTTDELPNYGLSEREKEMILEQTDADSECDLVVVFAYSIEEAKASKTVLESLLREAKYTWLYPCKPANSTAISSHFTQS
jgi:Glu-tRNA(Gln) amidotransferase subunit E-like FAD-binding protein